MKPKISVIIPVYNTEKYLHECINSVINQTLKEIEIICIDDGSTDSSLNILNQYAKKDSRIVVLKQENSGAGAARNKGLEIAKGEYISVLDSDDFFELTMLEKAYNYSKSIGCDLLIYKAKRYDNLNRKYIDLPWNIKTSALPNKDIFLINEIKGNIFRSMIFWTWDKLFKRSIIEENNLKFQEIKLYNDMLFTVSYLLSSKTISVLDDILVYQRVHGASISRKFKNWEIIFDALSGVRNFLLESSLYDKYKKDFVSYALDMFIYTKNRLSSEEDIFKFKELMIKIWLPNFRMSGYPKEFYYDKKAYDWMLNLLFDNDSFKLVEQIKNLTESKTKLENKLAFTRNSASYKIGRAITWLPRLINRKIKGK